MPNVELYLMRNQEGKFVAGCDVSGEEPSGFRRAMERQGYETVKTIEVPYDQAPAIMGDIMQIAVKARTIRKLNSEISTYFRSRFSLVYGSSR